MPHVFVQMSGHTTWHEVVCPDDVLRTSTQFHNETVTEVRRVSRQYSAQEMSERVCFIKDPMEKDLPYLECYARIPMVLSNPQP